MAAGRTVRRSLQWSRWQEMVVWAAMGGYGMGEKKTGNTK